MDLNNPNDPMNLNITSNDFSNTNDIETGFNSEIITKFNSEYDLESNKYVYKPYSYYNFIETNDFGDAFIEYQESPPKKIKENFSYNSLDTLNLSSNSYDQTNQINRFDQKTQSNFDNKTNEENTLNGSYDFKFKNFYEKKKYFELVELKFKLQKQNIFHYENISDKFTNNRCYCCKNYLIIHELEEYKFIEKYNKKKFTSNNYNNFSNENNYSSDEKKYSGIYNILSNLKPRLSSKYIKILFRLKPELFKHLNLTKYKYIENLPYNYCKNNENLTYLYENYFYQPDINDGDYVKCSICTKEYCNIHIQFNPFYMKKCSFCSKYWSICTWCKYDHLLLQFDFQDNIFDENIVCKCFHSNQSSYDF